MYNTSTLALIKPNVIRDRRVGEVITEIEKHGFILLEMQCVRLRLSEAQIFYEEHKTKPFYNELCNYIASGPAIAICLEKENAIEEFRKLIGATNPAEAAPGTLRQKFGKSITENAIHGSDSPISARRELDFFFNCCDSDCGCCCDG